MDEHIAYLKAKIDKTLIGCISQGVRNSNSYEETLR